MKKIWIIWAMQEEIDYLIESMKLSEQKDQFFIWTIWEYEVVLVKSWIWKVNAAIAAQRLISEFKVELIINTWLAWAINKSLNMLDFVVSKDAVYHDFDFTELWCKPTEIPMMDTSAFPWDLQWREKIIKCFEKNKNSEIFSGHKIIEWRIASWDQFIADKEIKQHIIDVCNPDCVEMEWASIAHVCRCNKIPFVIIRCMSDNADEKWADHFTFNTQIAGKISATLISETLKWDNN